MTKRAPFKQSDIERAAKALQALGKNVTGVEVEPDGSFRILTGTAEPARELSPLQRWKQGNGHRAA